MTAGPGDGGLWFWVTIPHQALEIGDHENEP